MEGHDGLLVVCGGRLGLIDYLGEGLGHGDCSGGHGSKGDALVAGFSDWLGGVQVCLTLVITRRKVDVSPLRCPSSGAPIVGLEP